MRYILTMQDASGYCDVSCDIPNIACPRFESSNRRNASIGHGIFQGDVAGVLLCAPGQEMPQARSSQINWQHSTGCTYR
jgi:hypothetical protein